MLGAIVGDVAGSSFEHHSWQGDWRDIPLVPRWSKFTDDTVLTIATGEALMAANEDLGAFRRQLVDNFHAYAQRYPKAGYGRTFREWVVSGNREPFNSWGNGSAMRVSPVGWAFETLEATEAFAAASADVTHNHPEGVKGAQAVAGCIFLARNGADKARLKLYAAEKYGYDMNRTLEEIRRDYKFEVSCQKSVPEAIIAFLESDSFEAAIQKAIWLRGDADTQAAIAGSIAEAFFGGVPEDLASQALERLDENLRSQFLQWRAWLQNRDRALRA